MASARRAASATGAASGTGVAASGRGVPHQNHARDDGDGDDEFLSTYRRAAELLVTLAALKEQRAEVTERKREAVRTRDACSKAGASAKGTHGDVHTTVLVDAGGGAMHQLSAEVAYKRAVAAIVEYDKRGDELDAAIDAFEAEYGRLPAWAKRNAGGAE